MAYALDPNEDAIGRAVAATPDALAGSVVFRAANVTTCELPAAAFDAAVLAWSL
jgi:hypothetical protein